VSRRSNEWRVYNADEQKFVIYAAHFDGDVTVAQRVKAVCVCKSDGKIRNACRILVDGLFLFRSAGLKVDNKLGGKCYCDGFDYGR